MKDLLLKKQAPSHQRARMAEKRHHMNFCHNIKQFHEKESSERQFYDFTIKDKDGAEVQSHKFILASQSEYFADLFSTHPNASETTFENFGLDVIKPCIDYLYNHEIELTRDNAMDVLKFADKTALTVVRDNCVDFIIKHIDRSNYSLVIEVGKKGGIDEMVEAAVMFVVKNLTGTIESLDDLTKEMITTIACRQQQRVTVMTQEQWNISIVKQLLTDSNEELISSFEARGSSVYRNNSDLWGPKFAIDGEMSDSDYLYFHSELEMYPWLEVKFPSPVLISYVAIINRKNGFWARLRNVEIRAGMTPVPDEFTAHENGNRRNKEIQVNSRCGYYKGPANRFINKGHIVKFEKPTLAQYITFQILEEGYLQINGLRINGGDLVNHLLELS